MPHSADNTANPSRLVPVAVDGPLPEPGTAVFDGAAEVGTIRSGRGGRALAMLRTEALASTTLRCGEAVLTPALLPWMVATEEAAR